jgi:hypothetical protein
MQGSHHIRIEQQNCFIFATKWLLHAWCSVKNKAIQDEEKSPKNGWGTKRPKSVGRVF